MSVKDVPDLQAAPVLTEELIAFIACVTHMGLIILDWEIDWFRFIV